MKETIHISFFIKKEQFHILNDLLTFTIGFANKSAFHITENYLRENCDGFQKRHEKQNVNKQICLCVIHFLIISLKL